MTTAKLPVENVVDLDRMAVLIVDRLTEKYLFVCDEGHGIGRRLGIYDMIKEEFRRIAQITEDQARKSTGQQIT